MTGFEASPITTDLVAMTNATRSRSETHALLFLSRYRRLSASFSSGVHSSGPNE